MSKKKVNEDSHKKILHIKTTNGYELWIDASQYKEIKYWNGWVTLIKDDNEEKHKKIGPIAFIEDNDTKTEELELLLDKVNSKLDYFLDYVTDDSWMADVTEYQEFKYWKENIQGKSEEKKGGTQQYDVSVNPIPMFNGNPVNIFDVTDRKDIFADTKERILYMPDGRKKVISEEEFDKIQKEASITGERTFYMPDNSKKEIIEPSIKELSAEEKEELDKMLKEIMM